MGKRALLLLPPTRQNASPHEAEARHPLVPYMREEGSMTEELKNYIAFWGAIICSVISGGNHEYVMAGVWIVMALFFGCLTFKHRRSDILERPI